MELPADVTRGPLAKATFENIANSVRRLQAAVSAFDDLQGNEYLSPVKKNDSTQIPSSDTAPPQSDTAPPPSDAAPPQFDTAPLPPSATPHLNFQSETDILSVLLGGGDGKWRKMATVIAFDASTDFLSGM